MSARNKLGQRLTWTTKELQEDYEVQGFMAPYVVVRRKSDGVLGSLEFNPSPTIEEDGEYEPRRYYNFQPHEGDS